MRLGLLSLLLCFMLVLPIVAQDDSADSEIASRTPSEICEAATPALDPLSREFSGALDVLEPNIDYRAVMCTSAGAIYIDLYESFTPNTVNSFIFLAEQGYYNNTIFHRVIADFMAQAGDPTGTGSGGPGYQFGDEIVGFLGFDRVGLLAMANSGPATNGSQFFITTAETSWLNGDHTIFGEVLEGQDSAVPNIQLRDPQTGGDATRLDTVVIIRDPALVDTAWVEEAEIATSENFVAGLDVLQQEGALPPDILASPALSLSTEEVLDLAPASQLEAYAAFLENYGHEYRVSSVVDNVDCNADYFFSTMVYSVDAFASAENATHALADDYLPAYYEAVGYSQIDMGEIALHAYSTDISLCGGDEIAVVVDIQRGRYLVNISVIYSATMVARLNTQGLAIVTSSDITQIFEAGLADAYRSELRLGEG